MTERELKVSKNPTKNRRFNTYAKQRSRATDKLRKGVDSGRINMEDARNSSAKDEIYRERKYYTDSDLIDSYGADAQRSKGFGREFQMGEKLSGGGKVRGMGAAKQGGKFGKNG